MRLTLVMEESGTEVVGEEESFLCRSRDDERRMRYFFVHIKDLMPSSLTLSQPCLISEPLRPEKPTVDHDEALDSVIETSTWIHGYTPGGSFWKRRVTIGETCCMFAVEVFAISGGRERGGVGAGPGLRNAFWAE